MKGHGMESNYVKCKECGKSFIPSKRRNQLYCSDNCRIVHNNRIFNAKRAERTGPNHVCEQCGKRFYSSHSAPRFCSLECYREHERECRRSRNAATAIARMRKDEKRRRQERDVYLSRRDLEAKAAGLPEERVSIGANGMRIVSRGNCAGGNASCTRHTP